MDEESRRVKVASVFSSMHTSVVVASARMLVELKRYNYVTPTNFLELVKVGQTDLSTNSVRARFPTLSAVVPCITNIRHLVLLVCYSIAVRLVWTAVEEMNTRKQKR